MGYETTGPESAGSVIAASSDWNGEIGLEDITRFPTKLQVVYPESRLVADGRA
jgi:hypothetical protein